MAENDKPIPVEIEATIADTVGEERPKAADDYQPIYKMIGDDKIPVSKQVGLLWKSRKDVGAAEMTKTAPAWDEAIKYYRHDQLNHRDTENGGPNAAGNRRQGRKLNDGFVETENLVYATINAMKPAMYSKNPTVACTTNNEALKPLCDKIEKLTNVLIVRKHAPGINLKPKARKGLVLGMLTNVAYLRTDWTFKERSLEAVQQELTACEKALAEAKTQDEVREIEGKLMALSDKVDALEPSGPSMKLLSGRQVIVDPGSVLSDMSDANWLMYCDVLPAHYVYAIYCEKREDDYKSIYKPTHVLASESKGTDINAEVDAFKLIKDDTDMQHYGYSDRNAFDRAQAIKVWYVWDKVTRRVYLMHDENWEWPLWVWNDPYKLDTFFNLDKLSFHDDPLHANGKGEITYILDQQDAINEINDETNRLRKWAKRNIGYNSNVISREEFERAMKGPTGEGVAFKLPEGSKLMDHIFAIPTPSAPYMEMFQKEDKYNAIDRITGMNDVLRGAQFKTNTTNRAIENYNATTQLRLDEKIDCQEDWLSSALWKVAQLCMRFMEREMVEQLIGEPVEQWEFSDEDILYKYNFRIAAGSTQKPTSALRKAQALELGQVLGQFVKASPMVLLVMLNAMKQAFDGEVVIDDDTWAKIEASVAQAVAGPPAGPGGEGAPPQQGAAPNQQQIIMQAAQVFDQMPPQAKQLIVRALEQGAPLTQVVASIMKQMSNKQPQSDAEGGQNNA